MQTIRTAEEVEAIRQTVEEMAEGLASNLEPGEAVDWHDFLDRLERDADLDLGSDMNSPAIRKIQAIARAVIRESQ